MSRKNGKHLEKMSQGIKKALKKDSSQSRMVKDKQTKSLSVFSSTKNMIKEEWYFDSGCSWHMIGNEHILTNLQPSSQDSVIFGDDASGRVIGTGSLVIPGLSKLKNLLLVEGLTMNLISVSQLCDENLLIQFIRDKCIVHNQNHCLVMEGQRTSDKCYLLTSTSLDMNKI